MFNRKMKRESGGGREGEREGEREGGREGGRERGREGEGGREGGRREREREGGREGGKEGGREGGRGLTCGFSLFSTRVEMSEEVSTSGGYRNITFCAWLRAYTAAKNNTIK